MPRIPTTAIRCRTFTSLNLRCRPHPLVLENLFSNFNSLTPLWASAKPLLQFQSQSQPKPKTEEICRGLKKSLLLMAVLLSSNPLSSRAFAACASPATVSNSPPTPWLLIVIVAPIFLYKVARLWDYLRRRDMMAAMFQFAFPGAAAASLISDIDEDESACGRGEGTVNARRFAILLMRTLLRHNHQCISIEPKWKVKNFLASGKAVIDILRDRQSEKAMELEERTTDEYIWVTLFLLFEGSVEMPHIDKDKKKAMENISSLIKSIPSSKFLTIQYKRTIINGAPYMKGRSVLFGWSAC